ncbi:MAG: hypothetical protein ACLP2U_00105 [Syntrophobacteraceae bacterium]
MRVLFDTNAGILLTVSVKKAAKRTLLRYAAQPVPAHIGLRLSVAVGRLRAAC